MKENRHLDENDNEQNTNVANDYDKSFVHNLEFEYMKKQNTATADLKTCSATSS